MNAETKAALTDYAEVRTLWPDAPDDIDGLAALLAEDEEFNRPAADGMHGRLIELAAARIDWRAIAALLLA